MERSPFLPLPEGMVIGQVEITPTQLTVEVISTQPCARCPGCGNPSDAVHCQYQTNGSRRSLRRPQRGAATRCAQVFLPDSHLSSEGVCRAASRPGPALGQNQ